jgi:peptidoglycan/xylan/chitin deacetylase (PgdA/CDA1 family)
LGNRGLSEEQIVTPLVALKSLAKAGGGPVARRLTAAAPRILMYHRFGDANARRLSPHVFEQHLKYLVRNFEVRRLTDVATTLAEGREFDRPRAVVTIDDGYADFAEFAYPLLQRYHVPATVFLATDFIDGNWLWFDANHYVLRATVADEYQIAINGTTLRLDLSGNAARDRAWSAIGEQCLRMTAAQRAAVLQQMERELDVRVPARPASEYRGMTWEQVRALDRGLLQFGAHTCTHPVLSRCSSAEIEYEVCESKAIVERQLGTSVQAFCYPHGEPEDYDSRAIEAVKAASYACATVAHGGPVGSTPDVYRLERIGAAAEPLEFRSAVNGVTSLADRVRACTLGAKS